MTVDDVRLLATAIAHATRNPESDEPDNTDVYVERVVAAFLELQPNTASQTVTQ